MAFVTKVIVRKTPPKPLPNGLDLDEWQARIDALPEFREIEGRTYRKSSLTGFYYPYQVEKVTTYSEAEWIEHAKTCPNDRCPGKKRLPK